MPSRPGNLFSLTSAVFDSSVAATKGANLAALDNFQVGHTYTVKRLVFKNALKTLNGSQCLDIGRLQPYTILPIHVKPAKEHVIFSLSDHLKEHVSGKLLARPAGSCLGIISGHHKEGMPGHRGPLLSGGRPGPVE